MEIDSDLIAIVKSELVFEGGGSSIELLMPHILPHLIVNDNQINIKDSEGEIRYNSINGRPFTVKEFIQELKQKAPFDRCFD